MAKAKVKNYVGMPAFMHLEEFGSQVWSAFGDNPYLVGSALTQRTWRDVDVRLILDDEEYKRLDLGDPERGTMNAKWCAWCMAFASLGRTMTALPVDFQIQQRTFANKKFPKQKRHPLGFIGLRFKENPLA